MCYKAFRVNSLTFWRAILAIPISGMVLIVTLNFGGGCSLANPASQDNKTGFEIHEWGVLVGCTQDTSYFLTSRPEQAKLVREPVIYVHSIDKIPFTICATFNSGNPTDTYPQAIVNGNSVIWEQVNFSADIIPANPRITANHVPLDSIIDILNNVDADCLEYNGQTARFLFYEGDIQFENEVVATYDFDNQQATFENQGVYPIFNLILVASKSNGMPFNPSIYAGRIEQLNPGEQTTVAFSEGVEVDPEEDLVSQGFTQMEAEAFAELWSLPFFYPVNLGGWANLIYRLSQEEYDELISLDINPQPTKIIRSLYILVHLNEDEPSENLRQ